MPGQYAGGIGENGADALREFVTQGGTLVALGNASLFAIEQFNLPVTNAVAGLRSSQFFCSGSLLRVEINEPNHPVVAGLPATPGDDVRAQPGVRHAARFPRPGAGQLSKDRNPLLSGFLLGADRIEGKAAALDADYGQGHIVLLGFRPQWRGQSHGTYKFLFNALYYSPPWRPRPAGGGGARRQGGRGGGNAAAGRLAAGGRSGEDRE